MKKILLTGSTGFVGKNILTSLRKKYDVDAPSRSELDVRDYDKVHAYLQLNSYDVVLHFANPNPVKNHECDSSDRFFEDSMRIYMNFYNCSHLYKKLIYLGSGAEYDKRKPIIKCKESDITTARPNDVYGFSKSVMNELAKTSTNIYNLRLFACYGPYDHESKFITHVIRCCLKNEDITIRQNCNFDYMHVYDIAKVVAQFIDNKPKYYDYNLASGVSITLLELAEKVKKQMDSKSDIKIINEGMNNEYTADISRLDEEFDVARNFISIDDGIQEQIAHERRYFNEKTCS